MGFGIIVMLANLGFSAHAEKLTYYSPEPQYEIERTNQELVLRTTQNTLKLTIRPCNKNALEFFWKEALREFERHPLVRGKPKSGEFAKLDGQFRAILPVPGSEKLSYAGRDFLNLIAMDSSQCSR
jgi:hypothetical protein